MTLTSYPLADRFTTTLSQQYNGTDTTIYVSAVPNITRPSGITTYLVLNPGNSLQQVVKISGMDAIGKTFTVSSTTIASWAGTNYTTNTHSIGDVVIISDNYAFRKDIKDAIDTKLSTDGGTRTGLTAHRLLYTDWSWVETQLAFWTNGQVLWFTGTTSAPAPVSPSVDINWLTNDDTNPTANDKFIRYKDWTGNVKRSMIASETVMWLVERATDAEVLTWTDTTRYVTPAQSLKYYWETIYWTTFSRWEANTQRDITTTTFVKQKEITANRLWKYTLRFEHYYTWASVWSRWYYSLRKNWTEIFNWWLSWSFQNTRYTITHNVDIVSWDVFSLWTRVDTTWTYSVRNYQLRSDITNNKDGTVNLD